MSRIIRGRIVDGDQVAAADLNTRFTDYAQTGALNRFNTRDGAVDLPQLATGVVFTGGASSTIGRDDWKHAAFNTVSGQTGTPAAPHIVSDATPTPTVLSLGASGFAVTTSNVLRVYWDLSVKPYYTTSRPWTAVGALGNYTFDQISSGTINVATGSEVWPFWLQWDVTSNALANFVDVPGQGDFNTTVGSYKGNALASCGSTSVVPAFLETAAAPSRGDFNSVLTVDIGWTSVAGAWHYTRALGATTVFGLRVVFTGVCHPFNTGGANYLVRDDAVSTNARLDYNGGRLQAVLMNKA
tara:strand:+ start:2266 stop:3159 length:894 start_codon:yes stop_codon:yes gene_type:complete